MCKKKKSNGKNHKNCWKKVININKNKVWKKSKNKKEYNPIKIKWMQIEEFTF